MKKIFFVLAMLMITTPVMAKSRSFMVSCICSSDRIMGYRLTATYTSPISDILLQQQLGAFDYSYGSPGQANSEYVNQSTAYSRCEHEVQRLVVQGICPR